MLISIIIPFYNVEQYFNKCIESIHNQSFQEFEAILVDDGSSDSSLAIARNWESKDTRFHVIVQNNQGVSAARNKGISKAKGDYICFIDADDCVEANYLEELSAYAGETVLPVCNFSYNMGKGVLLTSWSLQQIEFNQNIAHSFICGSLGQNISCSSCNKIFNLSVIQKKHISFPDDISLGEDVLFVLDYLSYCHSIRFIPKTLYHYRLRKESATHARNKDYILLYSKTFSYLQKHKFNNIYLENKTLSLWSLGVLSVILSSLKTQQQNYHQFSLTMKRLFTTDLYQFAIQSKQVYSIKRFLLSLLLKTKSIVILFLFIQTKKI
ncbi:MAG: glycosyltransferase family 2 protein [Sphaerochaeta sp.]|jgi:glycosyltransferase involved in cell wall biosynthesis|nr:glycosyltransferase family 2 protein [Sphaerochaeta sp.]